MKILVTGSAGFVGGYLVEELLKHNHVVVGIDNYCKYGKIKKSYDNEKNYFFTEGSVKDTKIMKEIISDCDQIVSIAAMVGGISFFNKFTYDLLSENEKILTSTFDTAIWAFKNRKLKKINVISTSMVYENTALFPTPEGEQLKCPPPSTTYGFQKLMSEYFAKASYKQHGLPYTIIRLYNCIGIGEIKALKENTVTSGNVKVTMNHVIPDLVQKILKGQDPLHILGSGEQVRHFTYGKDIAEGIRYCIEKKEAINEDFNIASPEATTILQVAEMIWKKINIDKPFKFISEKCFENDVQRSTPSVEKAKKLLGFEAKTALSEVLDEIILWTKKQLEYKEI